MTLTHDVLVQKDISLATGESLNKYLEKIREAGLTFVKQKLNIVDKSGTANSPGSGASIYPIEVFSKSIIFSVYVYGANVESRDRYYAAAYSRNKEGAFEFSALTEVERVVGYQPKESATSIKKAKDAKRQQEDELEAAPGWAFTTKAIWNDVL